MKKLLDVRRAEGGHWVGDGFPVRTLFSYHDENGQTSPFLLLDHAGPHHFEPATQPRGVGRHPHRGFETVTIVYDGEVEHGDSAGNSGKIGPGDVQWMTAASGVVHEEFHSHAFTAKGGVFEVAQLWVNLPAAAKMSPPRYQGILARDIPTVALANGAGDARIVSGTLHGVTGPAETVTPVAVWDVRAKSGHTLEFPIADGHAAFVVVLAGSLAVADRSIGPDSYATFGRDGDRIAFECREDAKVLVLSGQPIDEPVIGYGPFVMNTHDEIRTAIADYQSGRMGR